MAFSDLNLLTISGRLGKDPLIKQVRNGNLMATFSIASRYIQQDELYGIREETTWLTIVAWGEVARIVESRVRYGQLKKGDHITCVGRLSIRNVQDEATKAYKSYTQLVLESYQKNDRGSDKRSSGAGNGAEKGQHPSQNTVAGRFDNATNPEVGEEDEPPLGEYQPSIANGRRRVTTT